MVQMAKKHRRDGKPSLALDMTKKALAAGYQRWGERPDAHPNLMWVWLEMGASESSLGMTEESDRSFRNALALAEQTLGTTHPQVAYIVEHQGIDFMRQGKFEKAYEKFKLGFEILMSHTAEENYNRTSDEVSEVERSRSETRSLHREEIDSLFHNMIAALFRLGKFNECDSHYREFFSRFESSFAEDLETARFQNNWGLVLQQIGRLDDAERLFVESTRIRQRILGPNHPALVGSLSNLAQFTSHYRNDPVAAENYFQKAIQIADEALPPDHPVYLQEYLNYSVFLRKQTRFQESASKLRGILQKSQPTAENFQMRILCTQELGNLLQKLGDLVESERMHTEVIENLLAIPDIGLSPLADVLIESLEVLADIFAQQGRVAKAVEAKNLIKQMVVSHKT